MMKRNTLMLVAVFIASLNLRPAINSIPPLLESISSQLGMNATVASLLTSIPVLCMGIFSPIAPKASNKWGIERITLCALVTIGIGTAARLFAHSTVLLLITALIAGIGIAFIGPLLPSFIRLHFPNQVSSMIAIYTVAVALGASVSTLFSIPLQGSFESWEGSLAFWAVIAFVAAFIWWLFVNTKIDRSTHMDSRGMAAKLPWRNRRAWIITLSFGLMATLFFSFTTWLPQIIQDMGYTKLYAAKALTIFAVIQVPVSLVLSLVLSKFPSRRLWLIVESSFELLGLILLVFNIQPWLASAFLGIGAGGLFSLNVLLPIDATDHHHDAVAWSAKAQSVGFMIGAVGPIMLGWIQDATHSSFSSVITMIVIVLLMIIVQILATAKRSDALEPV